MYGANTLPISGKEEEPVLPLNLDPSNFLKPNSFGLNKGCANGGSTGKSSQVPVSFGQDTNNNKNESNLKLTLNVNGSSVNLSKPNSNCQIDMTLGVAKEPSSEKSKLIKKNQKPGKQSMGDFELLSKTVISKFHSTLAEEEEAKAEEEK